MVNIEKKKKKQDMEIANRTEHNKGERCFFVAISSVSSDPGNTQIRKRNSDKIGKLTYGDKQKNKLLALVSPTNRNVDINSAAEGSKSGRATRHNQHPTKYYPLSLIPCSHRVERSARKS